MISDQVAPVSPEARHIAECWQGDHSYCCYPFHSPQLIWDFGVEIIISIGHSHTLCWRERVLTQLIFTNNGDLNVTNVPPSTEYTNIIVTSAVVRSSHRAGLQTDLYIASSESAQSGKVLIIQVFHENWIIINLLLEVIPNYSGLCESVWESVCV